MLCHLPEAVAAPLSRGDSPKHGDRAPWLQRDPVFQQAVRRLLKYWSGSRCYRFSRWPRRERRVDKCGDARRGERPGFRVAAKRRFTEAPLPRSLPSIPSASTHDPFQFFNSLFAKLPKATSKGLKKLSGSCRITTACVLGYCHLSQFEEPTFATGLPLIDELV